MTTVSSNLTGLLYSIEWEIIGELISYDGHEMEVAYRIYDKATGEDRAVARSVHCFINKSGIPISMKRAYPELDTKFFEFK